MSPDVRITRPDARLDKNFAQMLDHAMKRVPVIQDGKIIGIVCRSDLLKALAAKLSATSVTTNDDEMQQAIVADLRRCTWSSNGSVCVRVRAGVATFGGVTF